MASQNKRYKPTLSEKTLQKIKSAFTQSYQQMSLTGFASDVRKRVMSINFQTMRTIAEKLSVVNMCINARERHVLPFLSPATEPGMPGFLIAKRGRTGNPFTGKTKDGRASELTEFVSQTGHIYDSSREDDFIDFGKMAIREVLTIDQIAIELQRNRRGELGAFWIIDGATISRAMPDRGYEGDKDVAFVQEVDNKVVATYTNEDLIFDYMFKRADLKYRGFGYSILEQAIDLVTTLISGITYNRDLFVRDKIPKGFIALSGEADDETIEAISRYWYAAMQSAGAQFSIPILPSGKEGVGMDWKTMGQSNRDMEYYKLMLFYLSLFAGVFGIDLAELGIKTDTYSSVISPSDSGRREQSKDSSLRSLLSFLETLMNKVMSKADKDYTFAFVGINPEDEMKKYEIQNKAVTVSRTINELREKDGLQPLEGEEYDTVLNPQLVQLKQVLAGQQQQQQGMVGGEGGEEGSPEGEDQSEEQGVEAGEEDSEEPNWELDLDKLEEMGSEAAEKSLKVHLKELAKAGYDVETE